jgi:hypothetical protein
MWTEIMERMPSWNILFYTFLSFAIPWTVFRVNQSLHKAGDPPWKENSPQEDK